MNDVGDGNASDSVQFCNCAGYLSFRTSYTHLCLVALSCGASNLWLFTNVRSAKEVRILLACVDGSVSGYPYCFGTI